MTIDPQHSYKRWHAAEAAGDDDVADAEFAVVFAAATEPPGVGAGFAERTMAVIFEAAVREARRSRRVRQATVAAGVAAAVAGAYFGAGFAMTLFSSTLARASDVLIALVVSTAGAAAAGADTWSVLAGIGRAAAAFVGNPTVTVTLFALQGIAVAALLGLQRLLGTDEESLK